MNPHLLLSLLWRLVILVVNAHYLVAPAYRLQVVVNCIPVILYVLGLVLPSQLDALVALFLEGEHEASRSLPVVEELGERSGVGGLGEFILVRAEDGGKEIVVADLVEIGLQTEKGELV